MIDLDSELITLAQATRYYPKGTHIATVTRHITRGIKTASGRVKLEAVKIGGRWATTEHAIRRFTERLSTAQTDPIVESPTRVQSKAHKRSKAILDALGC
jgi:hypothetical protein